MEKPKCVCRIRGNNLPIVRFENFEFVLLLVEIYKISIHFHA